jgi:hypothetical protein
VKTLIAITGCHARREYADAQRQTWAKDVVGADVRFVVGGEASCPKPEDELRLDCPDGYYERKQKIESLVQWTLDQGYDYLWKTDDDVYLRPERLLALPPRDYQGMISQDGTAAGLLYGLSRRSMEWLAYIKECEDWSPKEDTWVGQKLAVAGITPFSLPCSLVSMTHTTGKPNGRVTHDQPRKGNRVVASGESTPLQMAEVHRQWESGEVHPLPDDDWKYGQLDAVYRLIEITQQFEALTEVHD